MWIQQLTETREEREYRANMIHKRRMLKIYKDIIDKDTAAEKSTYKG